MQSELVNEENRICHMAGRCHVLENNLMLVFVLHLIGLFQHVPCFPNKCSKLLKAVSLTAETCVGLSTQHVLSEDPLIGW